MKSIWLKYKVAVLGLALLSFCGAYDFQKEESTSKAEKKEISSEQERSEPSFQLEHQALSTYAGTLFPNFKSFTPNPLNAALETLEWISIPKILSSGYKAIRAVYIQRFFRRIIMVNAP